MTRKFTKAEREEAIADLRESLHPGDTLWTVLRHRSASGMSRGIDVYTFGPDVDRDGAPVKRWLSRWISKATGFAFDDSRECLRVGGTGMDMGLHVVYSLSAVLFPDGFGCIGERCPSNDHSNGDRDYMPHTAATPAPSKTEAEHSMGTGHYHWHREGGFALHRRWI